MTPVSQIIADIRKVASVDIGDLATKIKSLTANEILSLCSAAEDNARMDWMEREFYLDEEVQQHRCQWAPTRTCLNEPFSIRAAIDTAMKGQPQ